MKGGIDQVIVQIAEAKISAVARRVELGPARADQPVPAQPQGTYGISSKGIKVQNLNNASP